MVEKNEFSVDDVCRILESCGKFHVAELTLGALSVKFGPTARETTDREGNLPAAAAELAALQENQAQRSLVSDEIRIREQQVAEMPLSDPLLYEEMLARGEIIDDTRRTEEE